jgi:anion-transporting  ArsA/GET3 family ATPase
MPNSLFQKRFIINTGKGGVGKTTISAALALAFAARGKKTLLMQLNVVDRLGQTFGVAPIGPEIVQIQPNLFAVNATPAEAMREYAMMIVKLKSIYKVVFQNKLVEKLLRVMPGLPELTLLGKAYFHEIERDTWGRPVWDVVIIDAPATGHGMFLLQIPQVISKALSSGRMADESKRMLALLEDPSRTVINLISLPEELPVSETLELRRQIAQAFRIQLGEVFVNSVVSTPFDDSDRKWLDDVTIDDEPKENTLAATAALLQAAKFQTARERSQRANIEKLQRLLGQKPVEIQVDVDSATTREMLVRISRQLSAALFPPEGN